MILADPKTHDEWLSARCAGIGGSDAACVLGMNKYKTNVQLWQEKTGVFKPKDISNKPAVAYGKNAEIHLRELFRLDFPQYDIEYHEYRMYANDKYPFIFATLDGELTDESGKKGILEIKTTTIQNSSQWDEWNLQIFETASIEMYFPCRKLCNVPSDNNFCFRIVFVLYPAAFSSAITSILYFIGIYIHLLL